MLPPVLEVYVVWHPEDDGGNLIAEQFLEHFHGTTFSGLIGGGLELYVRSQPWTGGDMAPRPIPSEGRMTFEGIRPSKYVTIVPLVGTALAQACQIQDSPWYKYLSELVSREQSDEHFGIFPYVMNNGVMNGTQIAHLLGRYQTIAPTAPKEGDSEQSMRCRDLTQGIAQLVEPNTQARLKVFISHTKRSNPDETENVDELIALVRTVIGETRLEGFFDAHDLQPGKDWDHVLRQEAANSALLAIRSDLFPSRDWCQREVSISKRSGMPMVILDSLGSAEERGSFLMDHVPRVAARQVAGRWRRKDIYRTLDLLVDECLKRSIWRHQAELATRQDIQVSWWAPHAPEPLTLIEFLSSFAYKDGRKRRKSKLLRILHPDPPLGFEERNVLTQLVHLAGIADELDIMTPRQLAMRGG